MTAEDVSLTGSCRCGGTRIELSAAPFMTSACHCTGCQKMSASAFSLTAMVPAEAFRVTAGEPVKGGIQGPRLDHYFCPDCKSWMFTRIDGMDFVNVRSDHAGRYAMDRTVHRDDDGRKTALGADAGAPQFSGLSRA